MGHLWLRRCDSGWSQLFRQALEADGMIHLGSERQRINLSSCPHLRLVDVLGEEDRQGCWLTTLCLGGRVVVLERV